MLEGAAVPSEEDIKAVREEMKAEKKKTRRGGKRVRNNNGNRNNNSNSNSNSYWSRNSNSNTNAQYEEF